MDLKITLSLNWIFCLYLGEDTWAHNDKNDIMKWKGFFFNRKYFVFDLSTKNVLNHIDKYLSWRESIWADRHNTDAGPRKICIWNKLFQIGIFQATCAWQKISSDKGKIQLVFYFTLKYITRWSYWINEAWKSLRVNNWQLLFFQCLGGGNVLRWLSLRGHCD